MEQYLSDSARRSVESPKSGRGLPHSKTLARSRRGLELAKLLDCGSPLPLFPRLKKNIRQVTLRTIAMAAFLVTPLCAAESPAPTFRNHVQPVLAKTGCNAGACHGAAAGQNGFRLSLRGYDDEGDHIALTRQSLGRRVNLSDPGRSLLLLKATATIPHKGGKRFEVDSREYEILSGWIAAGAPGPKAEDPRIERIELLPKQVVLTNGAQQQLTVKAHFSDGHS